MIITAAIINAMIFAAANPIAINFAAMDNAIDIIPHATNISITKNRKHPIIIPPIK